MKRDASIGRRGRTCRARADCSTGRPQSHRSRDLKGDEDGTRGADQDNQAGNGGDKDRESGNATASTGDDSRSGSGDKVVTKVKVASAAPAATKPHSRPAADTATMAMAGARRAAETTT